MQIVHAELKKHCVSIHAKIRNIMVITQTAIATPMKIPEVVGWIALGN